MPHSFGRRLLRHRIWDDWVYGFISILSDNFMEIPSPVLINLEMWPL